MIHEIKKYGPNKIRATLIAKGVHSTLHMLVIISEDLNLYCRI